jgi:hypothetical protein
MGSAASIQIALIGPESQAAGGINSLDGNAEAEPLMASPAMASQRRGSAP